MKTFIKLLLLALVAMLGFQYGAAATLTVCNSTSRTSDYAPVYCSSFDYGSITQLVYPKSQLNGLVDGDVITALTFYSSTRSNNNNSIRTLLTSTPVQVWIGNTTDGEVTVSSVDALDQNLAFEQMKKVYEGYLSVDTEYSNNNYRFTITITFDEGFEYEGKNIILDIRNRGNENHSSSNVSWYGQNVSGNHFACASADDSGIWSLVSGITTSFLPKMMITYNRSTSASYRAKLEGKGDFGIVNSGESATHTFTVSNRGTSSFTPQLVSNNDAFTISGDMSTPLEAGDSRDFQVKFTAGAVGNYTGTLTLRAGESTAITGTATLKGTSSITTNVADGSDTGDEVPIWGYNYEQSSTRGQMIYPESMLEEVAGKTIKSITFYPESMIVFDGGTISVEMGTTSTSSYASANPSAFPQFSGLTVTGSVSPAQGDGSMTINFAQPFEYISGNLMINTQSSGTGNYGSTYWLGTTTANYQSYYFAEGDFSDSGCLKFLPKITFEFVPTISVNKTELNFNNVAVNSTSDAKVVTVTNLTAENAELSWAFSGTNADKFSTTATATSVPAGGKVEIPVTFNPTELGEQTGTLTIHAGSETFAVSLSGKALVAYATTIDKQTIDFGHVAIDGSVTATVTLTNTGANDINPSFTNLEEPFAVTGVEGSLPNGESRTYTITFAPAELGSYNGSFTIADADNDISYTVTLSGVAVELDPITANPASLDFGMVNTTGDNNTKDLTVTFTNPNSEPVAVTLTTAVGYTVSPASFDLAANNGTQTVTVTFTPTAVTSYNGTLTANASGLNTNVTLKGIGGGKGSHGAIRDKAFFESITYNWTEQKEDGTTQEHTSNLSEIATDPDQIIAMLREVYMNKEIPGNRKRGFDANGNDEEGNDVSYAGVGSISLNNDNYSYADTYGWNIPVDADNIKQYNNSGRYYMDPTQYKPDQYGVTLLLVETNDALIAHQDNLDNNFVEEEWMYRWDEVQDDADSFDNSYAKLRYYISKSIRSVRVITDAKRTGEDHDAGTLFKIDCDKMNKFFLMAKGQLMLYINNSCPYPYFDGSWHDSGTYTDYPFFHMFEQFSPVTSGATSAKEDIYQELVNMESFGVIHDCTKMFFRGHQFMMYGADSESGDCADVRDMMFFVPDYRMIYWRDGSGMDNQRDPQSSWKYFNYNRGHQPQMGLFVIHQDEITDAAQVSGKNLYKHSLKWKSNLDDFLPGKEQEYELWEKVVDEFGMESYVPVYYRNANGQYTDKNGTVVNRPVPIVLDREMFGSTFTFPNVYVDMKEGSQIKTYVIRGRDKEHFLSLQMSNFQEVFIPGTDPNEKARMIAATYYSRYNPKNEMNCYSNRLELSNNGMTLTADDLSKGLQFYRSSRAAQVENGNVVVVDGNIQYSAEVNKELIATATVSGGNLIVELAKQGNVDDFPDGVTSGNAAGYHNNTTLSFPYTIRNGVVNFTNNFQFWDNFTVEVSENKHPLQYLYKMEIYASDDANKPESYSNEVRVPVYKTDSKINSIVSLDQVIEDNQMDEEYSPGDIEFKAKVQLSSKTEVLRYDAYRWSDAERKALENKNSHGISIVNEVDGDDEGDIAPTGMAGNQGDWYTVSMNDVNGNYYYAAPAADQPTVSTSNPTNWANFIDYYPNDETTETANEYLYAPVVELFTKGYKQDGTARKDYNSYGGPQKYVATGRMELTPYQPVEGDSNTDMALMSDYKWHDGNWYSYYNVYLNFSKLAVPTELNGYELYKVRAWRKVTGYQGGTEEQGGTPLTGSAVLGEEIGTRQVRVVDGWYMYEDINFGDDLGLTNAAGEHIEGYMSKDELSSYYLGHRSTKIEKPKYPESYSGYSTENQGGGPVFEPDSTQNSNATTDPENPVYVENLVDNEMRATFGALRLKTSDDDEFGTLDELKVEFKVRAYFVKTQDASGLRNPLVTVPTRDEVANPADFDYYVTEATTTFKQKAGSGVITGIGAVMQDVNREVVGVTYVNPVGQLSSTPWRGINIVVTRYSDGSTTTKKVIR